MEASTKKNNFMWNAAPEKLAERLYTGKSMKLTVNKHWIKFYQWSHTTLAEHIQSLRKGKKEGYLQISDVNVYHNVSYIVYE